MVEKKKSMNGSIIVDRFKKEVTASGNAGHISVSGKYIGDTARVEIIRKWRICQECSQTFINPENLSPDERYCKKCFEAKEFLKKNKNKLKCQGCGKKITEAEYKEAWNFEICKDCRLKEMEGDSEEIELEFHSDGKVNEVEKE